MTQIASYLRFELQGEKQLTEDLEKITIEAIYFRTTRVLGPETNIHFLELREGSVILEIGLVSAFYIALEVIKNYKTFKESLTLLISDIKTILEVLFKAESVESVIVEKEFGKPEIEGSVDDLMDKLKAETELEILKDKYGSRTSRTKELRAAENDSEQKDKVFYGNG